MPPTERTVKFTPPPKAADEADTTESGLMCRVLPDCEEMGDTADLKLHLACRSKAARAQPTAFSEAS